MLDTSHVPGSTSSGFGSRPRARARSSIVRADVRADDHAGGLAELLEVGAKRARST